MQEETLRPCLSRRTVPPGGFITGCSDLSNPSEIIEVLAESVKEKMRLSAVDKCERGNMRCYNKRDKAHKPVFRLRTAIKTPAGLNKGDIPIRADGWRLQNSIHNLR